MVAQLVVDGTELVEGLGVVVLQLGGGFQVVYGFSHLPHLDHAFCPQLPGGHVPHTRLGGVGG